MRTLLFEGIATSGKSTITERLMNSLGHGMTVLLATEADTHIPIMADRSELHVAFFDELIRKLVLQQPDLLVFDRLYMTQAYRANADLSHYAAVEDILLPHSPHTIILKVDESAIADRIKAAAKHREDRWREYLKSKGTDFDEIANGYIEQQRGLLRLAEQSKVPFTIFDTTSHDYEAITTDILQIIQDS